MRAEGEVWGFICADLAATREFIARHWKSTAEVATNNCQRGFVHFPGMKYLLPPGTRESPHSSGDREG